MLYYMGQGFGILATLCCLALPLFQKKPQMLVTTILINLFCGLNLVLIGRVSSVITIYIIAVIQTFLSLRHIRQDTAVSRGEFIFFLLLYVCCGSLALKGPLDLLPVVGAVFHMLATFQRDVQKSRFWILLNASSFLVYYALVGSTSALSSLCAIATTVFALCRHNARQK